MSSRLAHWVTLVLCFSTFLALLGCETPFGGGGGSAGSAPTAEAAIAVDPVDLAPGQTQAQLAWPASEGPVENYLVFESRNGSGYTFSQLVPNPTATISGQAGDRIQITVIGVSPSGEVSEASPPSPPLIFHAAVAPEAAAVAQAIPSTAPPIAVTADSNPTDSSSSDSGSTHDALANADADTTSETPQNDASTASAPLAHAVRAMLLAGNARLPERGLSTEASRWLQGRVDLEMEAGVSLAGTGRSNDDELREIVWLDQAGQLFLSDGQALVDSEDMPSTFDEALRLGATERFVGLADFDGDGRGDWLIEDVATGDVWMINGETEQSLPAYQIDAEARLAGLGDVDGDGRSELLWLDVENRLQVTRPGGDAPTLAPGAAGPEDFELLAIADLDGNGRDDLLGRTADGALAMALALDSGTPESNEIRIEWRTGSTDVTDQLDLVATVDVDEDGRAEIAWLNGDALEIWSPDSGLETTLER